MTICIQCALKALAEGSAADRGIFDETVEAHIARCHPDPEVTLEERRRLIKLLEDVLRSTRPKP